ncbi:MAG: integrase, partial [Planctomycetaceae bacterium]
MASISKGKNGHRTIQFVASDDRRRSIRLGKAAQRIAENVKVRVEALNAAIIGGQPVDGETARWIAGLDGVLRAKLAAVGLCDSPAARQSATLAEFLDDYITG